ncbi:MAG: beta-glucosidase [Opitutales bacterium]|nr:beta-glucosidase [Opitutales bacterium]
MENKGFGENFTWGCATASYQIEGAAREDGKGPSIWDMMCRWEGKIFNRDTGDTACDHYHRYAEDVGIMRDLGLGAYRFSISWPRVLPEGTGRVNEKGLAFYDRLVDALLEGGVTPYATLFHWDYPYELFCRGGWLNSDSPLWFAEYADVIVDRLGDRVKHWMTMNEPQCFLGFGHVTGTHAPGLKLDWAEYLRATHHALLAHGRAAQAIRVRSGDTAMIGWAPVGVVRMPASDSAESVELARRAMFAMEKKDFWVNSWFMDPVFLGKYPEDGLKAFGSAAPDVRAGDMDIISTPVDFLGLNIYNGQTIESNGSGGWRAVEKAPGHALTNFHWPVTPGCLYWGPKFLHERYGKPIVITENGLSSTDWVHTDGQVHDPSRIDFLRRYLRELRRAKNDGVDVRGYFQWSLLDNFEWAEGYKHRFGLVHIDYGTFKRTPKDSATWYKEVIASNGTAL